MQLLSELSVERSQEPLTIAIPPNFKTLRLLVAGELEAMNEDQRCLFTLNDITKGYKSFVNFYGDDNRGEWDENGFYLGRNGWHINCDLFADYTFTTGIISNKVLGYGHATFAMADGRLVGFEGHGALRTNAVLKSLTFACSGGIFSGSLRVLGI